jgi:hypothetical protein
VKTKIDTTFQDMRKPNICSLIHHLTNCDENYLSPIELTTNINDTKTLGYLLKYLDCPYDKIYNSFLFAIENESYEAIDMFLNSEQLKIGNAYAVNSFHYRIFYYAKKLGRIKICKYLVSCGVEYIGYKSFNFRNSYKILRVSNEINSKENLNYPIKNKGNEKWYKIPQEIWIKIVNDYFESDGEKTHYIFKIAKISKYFYNNLILSSKDVMKMFTFTLKTHTKISEIVKVYKPRYKIRNLSLIYSKSSHTKNQFKYLCNANFFQLYRIDISFSRNLGFLEINSLPLNLEVLELVSCRHHQVSDLSLSRFTNLKELNISGCDQNSISYRLFKNIGKNLKFLNIGSCSQLKDDIFSYIPKTCHIEMKNLKLTRNLNNKRKRDKLK